MADRRARLKGRRTSGRFALLPRELLRSPVVASLDPAVRWVLVALTAEYNGHNNGGIALTRATARDYGIRSADTLNRALLELERRGLIDRTDPGSYHPPAPARFAINWQPMNDTDYSSGSRVPTHDYRTWLAPDENKSSCPLTGPKRFRSPDPRHNGKAREPPH